MFAQVLYLDGELAPFQHLRIDVESKNRSGDTTVVRPLVILNYDPEKKDPYLFQYKLKNPDAALWLVLIDENGESKKKVNSKRHRYVFRNESEKTQEEPGNATGHRFENDTKVVNINNYFKEVTMARTVISGTVTGSVLNLDSTLTNVTQSIGTLPHADQATKDELQKLVGDLFEQLKKVPTENKEVADAVAAQTEDVVEKAKQDKPNKTLLQIAVGGLKSAAETLKNVAPSVVSIVTSIAGIIAKLHGL
jgi:hypothetical protein